MFHIWQNVTEKTKAVTDRQTSKLISGDPCTDRMDHIRIGISKLTLEISDFKLVRWGVVYSQISHSFPLWNITTFTDWNRRDYLKLVWTFSNLIEKDVYRSATVRQIMVKLLPSLFRRFIWSIQQEYYIYF